MYKAYIFKNPKDIPRIENIAKKINYENVTKTIFDGNVVVFNIKRKRFYYRYYTNGGYVSDIIPESESKNIPDLPLDDEQIIVDLVSASLTGR